MEDVADHVLVYIYINGIVVAQDCHSFDTVPGQIGLEHSEVLGLFLVEEKYLVSVAESHVIGQLVHIDAVAFVADITVSPFSEDAGVHQNGKDEVEQHASGHHQKPLPCRLCAELPWLRLVLEIFGVHRLVHHSRNLAVSSERKPADAIFCLPLGCLGAYLSEPFRFCAEYPLVAGVEEQVELVHSDSEYLREKKVSEFVYEDEY